ncbi:MAG TPA: 16S rRNA (guanine(527)-N(7))-methyltransferase RsmG [Acholeplasmataceae bacterium]|nr:16S rRNA (guanine(527)-N(7))-methyltransferase RsmG [Acholeplasmataceae bacterium]
MLLNPFDLNDRQRGQLSAYYEFLRAENEKYNLTAITERNEVYIKHFYDSLAAAFFIDFTKIESLCDIGSGGGLPVIPLKIAFPHMRITLIEPTGKKMNFLKELCRLLDLGDIEFVNGRAEDFGRERREYYDAVTARAVAALPVLLELAIPLLKVSGMFIAYKGSNYRGEVKAAVSALKKLAAVINDVCEYQLPEGMGDRAIIRIRKLRTTDRTYPRPYSQIKKKSL